MAAPMINLLIPLCELFIFEHAIFWRGPAFFPVCYRETFPFKNIKQAFGLCVLD